jgi:hypothetical protein
MRRLAKNASVWALAGLFGCISLFGQGWHCFVGHHGPAVCCQHEHLVECAADHEHELPTGSRGAAVAAGHDDCALCDFFAQAQWVVDFEPAGFEPVSFENARAAAINFGAPRIDSYHSRAPPLVARIF